MAGQGGNSGSRQLLAIEEGLVPRPRGGWGWTDEEGGTWTVMDGRRGEIPGRGMEAGWRRGGLGTREGG